MSALCLIHRRQGIGKLIFIPILAFPLNSRCGEKHVFTVHDDDISGRADYALGEIEQVLSLYQRHPKLVIGLIILIVALNL